MSLYKIKLVVGEYLMNDEMIKHLPYIKSKIEWFKKNNEPFDIIYIGEIHNKEMDEIIKALTFICRESTLDNFDITRIDEITIELIKTIEFLGFSELSDKIFSALYHLIKNFTVCVVSGIKYIESKNQIKFKIENIIRHPEKIYEFLNCTLSMYSNDNLIDTAVGYCRLDLILPISFKNSKKLFYIENTCIEYIEEEELIRCVLKPAAICKNILRLDIIIKEENSTLKFVSTCDNLPCKYIIMYKDWYA